MGRGYDWFVTVFYVTALKNEILRNLQKCDIRIPKCAMWSITTFCYSLDELTNSVEKSPFWEAKSSSASQGIPHIIWNPKALWRIHKRPLPVLILSQNNAVHNSPSHFLNIYFNIIFSSALRSSKWSVFTRSPHENPVGTSSVPNSEKKSGQ
jgi:hypothetical protein